MGKYDNLTADKLRDEAGKRKLPTSGTKAELVARLEEADAETDTAANTAIAEEPKGERKSQARLMLAKDGTIDADRAYVFANNVRALADELRDRLDAEVVQPLTDMEHQVNDPNSGRMVAASRNLRSHVDHAQKALRALSSAASTLAQDSVA